MLREEHTLMVFKNSLLRETFRAKGEDVREGCRKLHNKELYHFYSRNIFRLIKSRKGGSSEELYDLYSSPTIIILVIKSRRMRWAGHVACMGDMRGAYRFWWGNLMERDHREHLGVDRRLILGWICGMWVYGLDCAGPG
jgi:hypothetical protein